MFHGHVIYPNSYYYANFERNKKKKKVAFQWEKRNDGKWPS